MTRLSSDLSPCRRHPCSVEHAELVRSFRELADAWWREAEKATRGYEAELSDGRAA